jgi:acetyl-CoA carboxylase alpha subunit
LETLIRVPSLVFTKVTKQDLKTKKVVGSVVKEFIEDAKEQLQSEKQTLKKETFEQ